MFDAITFFIVGTSVFCIGLATGWGMRGSVKEEERQRYESLHERMEKVRWNLDDLQEKVSK